MQHTFDLIQTVAFLTAFLLLASRLFVASRPFWSRLPAWSQTLLPVLVPTVTATVQGLAGVKSWSDLSVLFMVSAGMLLPGLPSNRSAAPLQAGKDPRHDPSAGDIAVAETVIAKRSIRPQPLTDADITPITSMLPPALVLLLAIGCAIHAQACRPSGKPCNPADVAAPTAAYVAKMRVLCKGYTFDACPARPALEADLKKETEALCPKS